MHSRCRGGFEGDTHSWIWSCSFFFLVPSATHSDCLIFPPLRLEHCPLCICCHNKWNPLKLWARTKIPNPRRFLTVTVTQKEWIHIWSQSCVFHSGSLRWPLVRWLTSTNWRQLVGQGRWRLGAGSLPQGLETACKSGKVDSVHWALWVSLGRGYKESCVPDCLSFVCWWNFMKNQPCECEDVNEASSSRIVAVNFKKEDFSLLSLLKKQIVSNILLQSGRMKLIKHTL